jgi:hypothetical protein
VTGRPLVIWLLTASNLDREDQGRCSVLPLRASPRTNLGRMDWQCVKWLFYVYRDSLSVSTYFPEKFLIINTWKNHSGCNTYTALMQILIFLFATKKKNNCVRSNKMTSTSFVLLRFSFFLLTVLGFKLRVPWLLGRRYTTWAMAPSLKSFLKISLRVTYKMKFL